MADGFGSMPLGNIWAWPSKALGYDQTLAAMKAVAARVADVYRGCKMIGHPIDVTHTLEPELFKAADAAARDLGLAEPIPKLATFVAASAFDAALHDAFGKIWGKNVYRTYGPDYMNHDLGHYLGHEFAGESLINYVAVGPKPTMPLYHLIGALDPLTARGRQGPDRRRDAGNARRMDRPGRADPPEDQAQRRRPRLGRRPGGGIDRAAAETQARRGVAGWVYSLDFNERCQNVGYLVEFLNRLKEQTPAGYDRVQYVEQPTARDLKANPDNRMHEAAELRPVVIDESLLDLETLHLAREMGYTGVAFKACKGQTQTMLLAAAAQKYGLFLCVQDLTCPGASLIQSAGIAAHIPGVAAIEANARQFCPGANAAWDARFPGVFTIRDGQMNTAILNGPGLGRGPGRVRGRLSEASPDCPIFRHLSSARSTRSAETLALL